MDTLRTVKDNFAPSQSLVQVIADAMDTETVGKSILPTVIAMSNDKVANVRFNVAKTLQVLNEKVDAE